MTIKKGDRFRYLLVEPKNSEQVYYTSIHVYDNYYRCREVATAHARTEKKYFRIVKEVEEK